MKELGVMALLFIFEFLSSMFEVLAHMCMFLVSNFLINSLYTVSVTN